MTPRIGFVLEQSLGLVAYGMSLQRELEGRSDMQCEWLPVAYPPSRLSELSVLGRNWTLRGSARARWAAGKAHREQPLDALFINTQTISVMCGDLMRRIPTVLSLDATPRNFDELATHYGEVVHSDWVERSKLLAHRAVMSQAAWFTVWSEWTKRSLVNDYRVDASRITVLPPGTHLSNFKPKTADTPRKPGPFRLLFCGGDFLRKGGDLLLDVFRTKLKDRCELHLITGMGAEPEPGVHVHRGLKPHSAELLALYDDADAFVLPTRGDCLAVVLGEAMAASLPIITTRVGAHPEAVVDGETGYLMDVDDGAALADRILRLVDDPQHARAMGLAGRARAEARFDVHKNANAIGDILHALALGQTPPAP